jgi:cytochrome c553
MRLLPAIVISWALCLVATVASAQVSGFGVPEWLFPLNPPTVGDPPPPDDVKLIHLPNSKAAFTQAQLLNLFSVPDWHPATHQPMPDVVAHGHAPDVFACGFCHMPGGQGRPENASLSGLPAQYIIQQVQDFKSGARRMSMKGYLPTEKMARIAQGVSAGDLAAAADYFAAQPMTKRTRVIETALVPKMHVVGWIYTPDAGGGTEPLGERLLEMTRDPELHEQRADGQLYVAYAPVGSIARGKSVAGSTCAACHGEHLQGVGLIPPLAGRFPTYILRQLVAFKTGARAGTAGTPMKAVVESMNIDNMIDIAAYAASLQPQP